MGKVEADRTTAPSDKEELQIAENMACLRGQLFRRAERQIIHRRSRHG